MSGRHVALSLSVLVALCAPFAVTVGSAASGPRGTIAVTIGADLWTVSADGTQRTRLTRDGRSRESSWSADGRRLVFARFDGSLHVLRVGDPNVRTIALSVPVPRTSSAAATEPAWARDGRIAFVLHTGRMSWLRPAGIWVVNSNGSGARRVVDYGRQPAWSPDGRTIAFTESIGFYGERAVAVVSAGGGAATRIASGSGPAWSPDGRRIAFFDGSRKLTVANADGSEARTVADTGCLIVDAPSWSPDGRWLAYSACPTEAARGELFVVASSGGTPIRLLGARYGVGAPDWRPVVRPSRALR